MKTPCSLFRPASVSLYAIVSLILFLAGTSARAANHTWTGGGGNSHWSTAANWSGGKPTTGETGGTTVTFGTNTTTTMDIAGLVVDLIHFAGGGNVVNGSTTLGINGVNSIVNVQSDTGTNSLSLTLPLHFSAGPSIEVVVTAGTLTIGGNVSSEAGSRGLIVYNGAAGTLAITSDANSYAGITNLYGGLLQLNSGGINSAIPGDFNIGGQGSAATVRLLQYSEIATSGTVTVGAQGVLDLNGFFQAFGNLSITDGSVTVGAGTLATTGSNPLLSMSGGSITTTGTGTVSLGGDISATSSATGKASITGKIALNSAQRVITVNPGGSAAPELLINALITDGSASSSLIKEGAGTLALQGSTSNTYSGTLYALQGVVTLNASAGFLVPGPLVIGNSLQPAGSAVVRELNVFDIQTGVSVQINASGVFDLNGFQDYIGVLTGNGGLALTSPCTLTVGNGNVSSIFAGAISGTGSLYKVGTGTLTLTGDSSGYYAADTTVNGGTLRVDGILNPDFAVVVNAGGTVGGTGTLGDIISKNGTAGIAPGDATLGSLNCSDVDMTMGGTMTIRIDDSKGELNDSLPLIGTLFATGASLHFNVTGTPSKNVYIIGSYYQLVGSFNNVTGVPAGYTLNYDYSDGSSTLHKIALVGPLSAVTAPATDVTGVSATLHGTVFPAGKVTSWYFEYGLNTAYGSKTPVVSGITGSASKGVSAVIAGLNGGQTYHFQLVINNSSGPGYGADFTFTTPGALVYNTTTSQLSALSTTLQGDINPNGAALTYWFEYGLTAGYGSKTPVQSLPSGNALVMVSAALTGLKPATTYHARTVASQGGVITRGEDTRFTTLTVLPPVFNASGLAKSAMKAKGSPVTFTVSAKEGSLVATDAPLTYQWARNGVAIKGATATSYTIPAVTLAQAGTYSCVIKNVAGSVSCSAELGVVDNTSKSLHLGVGGKAVISVAVAGKVVAYSWFKGVTPLSEFTTGTITLSPLQLVDAGDYRCSVFGTGSGASSGITTLTVSDAAPIILTPVSMPDGIVGGNYSFQIPVDNSTNVFATSYAVSGLPAGVSFSPVTGLISGRPTTAVSTTTTYHLALKASNSKGTTTATASLMVHPFPTGLAGGYSGLVNRDALPLGPVTINGGHGGVLSIAVSPVGALSGKLTLGAAVYPFTGIGLTTVGSTSMVASVNIARKAPLHSWTLSLLFTPAGVIGNVSDSISGLLVSLTASINPWNATSNKAPLAATYTSQIKITDPNLVGTAANAANIVYPQGSGFSTVTISPAGAVTWVGKMADGTGPTATYATTMAQNGSFPVHLMLDSNTGSAQGTVTASADTGNVNNGLPLLDGGLDWTKIAAAGSTNRTYKNIPLFDLTVAGGKYLKPAALVLGLNPVNMGMSNAKMVFTDGGLTNIASSPPVTGTTAALATSLSNLPLRITSTNTADFSPSPNPAAVTLTLNTTTGAMSGSFTLTDGTIVRKVAYSGLLVPRLSVKAGVGYFLLSELPTPATTPFLSGQVLLEGP